MTSNTMISTQHAISCKRVPEAEVAQHMLYEFKCAQFPLFSALWHPRTHQIFLAGGGGAGKFWRGKMNNGVFVCELREDDGKLVPVAELNTDDQLCLSLDAHPTDNVVALTVGAGTTLVQLGGNGAIASAMCSFQTDFNKKDEALQAVGRFSQCGAWFATGGDDGNIRLWSYPFTSASCFVFEQQQQQGHPLPRPNPIPVNAPSPSDSSSSPSSSSSSSTPSSTTAPGGSGISDADLAKIMQNVNKDKQVKPPSQAQQCPPLMMNVVGDHHDEKGVHGIEGLAFNASSSLLASVASSHVCKIWRMPGNTTPRFEKRTGGGNENKERAEQKREEKHLFVKLELIDHYGSGKPFEFRGCQFVSLPPSSAAGRPKEALLAILNAGSRGPCHLAMWDTESWELMNMRQIDNDVACNLAVSADHRTCAVSTQRAAMHVFNLLSFQPVLLRKACHDLPTTALCFAPLQAGAEKQIMSTGGDKTVVFVKVIKATSGLWNLPVLLLNLLLLILLSYMVQLYAEMEQEQWLTEQ